MRTGEEAWRPSRRIGGSDIAKLLGLSKYGNARDVYERVVNGVELEWSQVMERGAAVEPILRAHGQNMLGLEIEDCVSDYHAHPEHEFAGAQVDDIAVWRGLPVVVDYKSVSRWAKGWGADGSDEVPEHIRVQMTWEMACANRPLGLLVAGFGEDFPPPDIFRMSHVLTYQVERDEVFEALCVQTAREFWAAHVLTRTPPEMEPIGNNKRSKPKKQKTEAAP